MATNQQTLQALEQRRDQFLAALEQIQTGLAPLQNKLDQGLELNQSETREYFDLLEDQRVVEQRLSIVRSRIRDVQAEIDAENQPVVQEISPQVSEQDNLSADSAGDIVENEQNAREDRASVQSPPQQDLVQDQQGRVIAAPDTSVVETNAIEPDVQDDIASNLPQPDPGASSGISDPEIANQSNSPVGNDTGGAVSTVGGASEVESVESTQRGRGTVIEQPGERVAALDDDAVSQTQSSTGTSVGSNGRPTVAKEFLEPIVSKPNLFSGLSSLTYSLSLYLMSPEEFANFAETESKILPTNQLLIQSGGINNAERNEWFNVDFYIEDFILESVVGTQDVGSPHNAVSLEMTIVEPQGITLLNRLNNAVIDTIGQGDSKINPLSQSYLMVIRFYGYDAAGNAVNSVDLGLDATTDSDAVVEKFIPFLITNFQYKIATKATEYQIKGACHGTNLAFSTQRGEVPFNIQLTAGTVDQLFNGNKVLGQAQADETNNDSQQTGTTQTIVSGLVEALNEQQQRLAGESYDIADQYEIIFNDPDIKNAKLLKPGNASKGTASNQTSKQSAQKYLESRLNYDKDSRSWSVPAGTTVAQLLDLVLRTSSYITSQQDVFIDEKTGQIVSSESQDGQANSVPTVQWYRIKTQAVPLDYDTKRKTIAYKITYIIDKYQINTPRSPYFPPAEYRGVHKLYNYWFTGQNSEVLDFEIDVNNNYFVVIGNDGRVDTRDPGKFPAQQSYSSAPGQSLQGGERGSTVPAANLSDRLYSIGDVASASIEIVGDPDWIQQSELVYNKNLGLGPFAPDGSVNYDSSEVLFELRFNPVQDYDLETGLSNVYENNRDITLQGINENYTQANVAQESLVWTALTVTSMFKQGSFTQRISGAYRDFASAKNAPVNPQAEVVLSDGNTVEQSLAKREQDDEPTGAIVGGVRTNAGGTSNRQKAQTQRNNLNNGQPRTQAPNRNVIGGRSRAAQTGVTASANQSVDDDAGVDTTRIIGGRSARARQ